MRRESVTDVKRARECPMILRKAMDDIHVIHGLENSISNTYGNGTAHPRWAKDLRRWIIIQRATDCALTAREAESTKHNINSN